MINDVAKLTNADQIRLESLLLEFDRNWGKDSLAVAAAKLRAEHDDFRQIGLVELIKIDMHRQWEQAQKKRIDDYAELLTSIGIGSEIPPRLVLAEYLARHATGDSPQLPEYQSRFPGQFGEFQRLLAIEQKKRSGFDQLQATIDTSTGKASIDTHPETLAAPDSLPDVFGRYRIQKRLGSGAMGAVFLAHDTQLDRQVALKTPTFGAHQNNDLVERFYREARAAANLRHPNICPVFDVGQIDGRHYITMAFIDGRPLSDYIGGTKHLSQKGIATTVRKLALALADAHKAGVIHRDLKPANIMVDKKRQPLVMDFGLARREDDLQSRMTQSGTILGTPAYMPPEQVRGKIDEVGPQADIYSLGVIFYELLTGKLPFEGSIGSVIGQILTESPTPPVELRPGTDPVLQSICLRMMAKETGDRFQSMTDVATDLVSFLKGDLVSAIETIDVPAIESIMDSIEVATSPDPLALPDLQASAPMVTPALKPKPMFWMTPPGRYTLIGGALFAFALIALSIILVFKTPYGTITITSDDPNIVVEIDGKQIAVRDESPLRFLDGSHDLSIRIGDQSLPIGSNVPFEIAGRDGKYQLSTTIGKMKLTSGSFSVDRGENAALQIELTPVLPDDNSTPVAMAPDITGESTESPSVPAVPTPDVAKAPGLGPITGLKKSSGRIRDRHGVRWLAFAPDGRTFASGANDNTIMIWNTRINEVLGTLTGHASEVKRVEFSPDGKQLASIEANRIFLWDVASQAKLRDTSAVGVQSISYSPDEKFLAWSGTDNKIHIIDPATLDELKVLSGHTNNVNCVAYSPDSKTLASSSNDGTIRLWDVANDHSPGKILRGHEEYPMCVAFSPDSQTLASSGKKRIIKLWDVANGTRKLSIPNALGYMSLSFSPDGNFIAGGGVDQRIKLWNTQTGELVSQSSQDNDKSNIVMCAFSPDGNTLISCNTVWQIMTWKVLRGE